MEDLHKLFEPYFTEKSEKNGAGLGLYISSQIIEKHLNGKLELASIQGGFESAIVLYDTKYDQVSL